MKKNGFTLIELLAVIVILAIISLIATPMVINLLDSNKEETNLLNIKHYINAIEVSTRNSELEGDIVKDGVYSIMSDGNICLGTLVNDMCSENVVKVQATGDLPSSGLIMIKDGSVIDLEIEGNDKIIILDQNGKLGYGQKNTGLYENGKIVYFDVAAGKGCTKEDYENSWDETDYSNSYTGYNGIDGTGNQNSCLKFYAFNDTQESATLNLLLDHNTTATVAWASNDTNVNGPSLDSNYVLGKLKKDTSSWFGTIEPENYISDQSSETNVAGYTVDYRGYKARLITANELANITGANTKIGWDETLSSNSSYYFDTLTTNSSEACTDNDVTTECKYGWLNNRTNTSCTQYGCINNSDVYTSGYWTVSSNVGNSNGAWFVDCEGYVDSSNVTNTSYGVRPVVTVYKFIL